MAFKHHKRRFSGRSKNGPALSIFYTEQESLLLLQNLTIKKGALSAPFFKFGSQLRFIF